MSPDDYFAPKKGEPLLVPGQSEIYRGQCVQSVGLWVEALGLNFPTYLYAYLYYINDIPGYDRVAAGESIKEGDIIVWGPNFPSSPNAGHIDVAAADGSIDDFWGWDSNWNPLLKLNKIHHTGSSNNYISGYLRRQGEDDMEQKINRGDLVNLFRQLIGRDPNDNDYEFHLNRPGASWNRTVYDLLSRADCLLKADNNYVEDCAVGTLGRSSVEDADLLNNVGSLVRDCLRNFVNYPEAKTFRAKAQASEYEPVTDQLFKKKN